MNEFVFSLIISSILSLLLTIYLWLRRTAEGGRIMVFLLGAVTYWSFLYALEINAPALETKILIAKLEYLAILAIPSLWLLFSLDYLRVKNRIYPKFGYLLFIFPAIIYLFIWTNQLHQWYWSSNQIRELSGTLYLDSEYGVLYWFYSAYAYVQTFIGSGLLVAKAFRSRGEDFGSAMLLGIGSMVPILTNLISLTGWLPNPYFDLTPIGLALAIIILTIAIFRFRILDVIPKGQNALFNRWEDAFLILDEHGRIIECNKAVQQLPFIEQSLEKGMSFTAIREAAEFIIAGNPKKSLELYDWEYQDGDNLFYFDIMVWAIDEEGEAPGWMLGIRDVSQKTSNKKKLEWREQILTEIHHAELEYLQSADLEQGLEQFAGKLGLISGARQVYLFQHSIDDLLQSSYKEVCQWAETERSVAPVISAVEQKLKAFSGWSAAMNQGELKLYKNNQLNEEAFRLFSDRGVQFSVSLPVYVENQWWGILVIDWAEPKYIQSEQDAQFFFTAANAIGAAISRESVYLEMDRKAGFLSFLGQLSLEGNKDQSFNDLHKNLTTLLTEFSRAEHVIILCKELIDTDANQVPPDIVQVYQELEDSLLPVSLSPADEAFPESFLDFKAVISFPIISTQVFLGGIIFFFKDFKTFRTDEIEDYLQVINQIGLILAKAKNLTMLEAHVKERTLALEESNQALIQQMVDKEKITLELLENQEMYRSLFENSSDPIFIMDLEGNHLQVNQKAADLLGYTTDELVKLGRDAIVFEDEIGQSTMVLQNLLDGQTFPPYERTFIHKNGSRICMEVNATIIEDKFGNAQFIQSVARDVSFRKEKESQIELQFKRLSSLRKIDRMVSKNLDLFLTLDILVREVIDQLNVDAADVLLINKQTGTLKFESGFGFNHPAIQTTEIVLGEGSLGRAAQERQMLRYVHSDLAADFEFERFTDNPDEGFSSYYAVPLEVQGQIQGVLEVFHREQLNPTEEWLDFLETLASQAAIAIDNSYLFTDLEKTNKELEQAYVSTLEGWARALDLRDNETAGHTERVTEMTVSLGSLMGLSSEELVYLQRGAILHDIGKMGVPDAVLLKPGKLDPDERSIMEQHPQYAYDMLSQIEFLRPSLDIPYCHHEKFDGTGYPRGLKGEDIPMGARIFCIVDVWDALTSDRPYRKAWTPQKTFDYICELSGTHFDPQVVRSFCELLEYTTDFEIDWEAACLEDDA